MKWRRYPWHEAQWAQIERARRADRLPHAMLIAGAAGIGKQVFARRFAASLLCPQPTETGDACGACPACRLVEAGTHPDLLSVEPQEARKRIRIDAVRELSGRLVLAPEAGAYRVALIDPADTMNHAAANALLKTLEEPVARTALILVSSHPDRLPMTVRSRCQTINFPVPDVGICAHWLEAASGDEDVPELMAISGGAPLRALQALEEDWIAADRRLVDELASLKERKSNPIDIVEEWQQRPLSLLVDGLKRCLSDLVRLSFPAQGGALFHPGERENLQSLGSGIDLKSLFRANDDLMELERAVSNNLNTQMMLEHIANQWLGITRPGGH